MVGIALTDNFMNAPDSSSTRPYLIRALYEWCTDNGLTPYVAVSVDETVQVPREYVKNNEIVLNISFDATSSLKLGNDFIEFKARFAGSAREIMVPITNVIAIYARENGQGMAFPMMPSPASMAGPSEAVEPPYAKPESPALGLPAPNVPAAAQRHTDGVDSKIMQLVPESHPASDGDDGTDPPDPPSSPPRSRPPALKRVK
jgi:stringent starvation protein B